SQWGHIIPSTVSVFAILFSSFSKGQEPAAEQEPSWFTFASASGFRLAGLIFLSRLASWILKRFRRRAFVTTQKLDRLIAAAPNMGFSVQPKTGIHTPAARGIPITL